MPAAVTIAPVTSLPEARQRRLLTAIAFVATAGIAISAISLYHHFGTSKTPFCNFGESFNCDVVNRSIYSTVLGIPVALIGVGGYLLILALATIYRKNRETRLLLVASSFAGLVFSLRLTYFEKFVLQAWCILCLTSLALITIAAILSAALFLRYRSTAS